MLSRVFALVLLVALIGAGLYYWKVKPGGAEDIGAVGQRLQDTKTTAAVRAALGLSRSLKPYAIEVTTEEGVVSLRGDVPGEDQRGLAEKTAAAVPGVRQVVNHLHVKPGIERAAGSERTIGESIDDQALEVQVRLAFSLNRDLEGTDIAVRVFRRQVALSGEVSTEAQRRTAVALARETAQVAGVSDELRIRSAVPAAADRRSAVERALAANPNLARYRLEVREQKGRVVLAGRVRTGAEKELAGLLARDAAGAPVDNALQVKP